MANSGFAASQLRSFIERVERLEEEKAALAADIREVYSEAKSSGFDVKIMRQTVRLRKLDATELQEQQAMLDMYMSALGMLSDTPLGNAAIEKVAPRAAMTAKHKVEALPPHDPETGEIIEPAPEKAKPSSSGGTVLSASDGTADIPAFFRRQRDTELIPA